MTMVTGLIRMRRVDVILESIRRALEKRKSILNGEVNIRSVTVSVKFKNGTDIPRVVLTMVEMEDEVSD